MTYGMPADNLEKLTPRQKQILRLIVQGFDAKSAARELGVSVHTVNEHLREARRTLEVSSSREAARLLVAAEEPPPKSLGSEEIGIPRHAAGPQTRSRSNPKARLVYGGVLLVIILTLGAYALSLTAQRTNFPQAMQEPATSSTSRSLSEESPYQFRDLKVSPFEQVAVAGPFKVGIFVSREQPQVSVQGPAKMLADLITSVENGNLTIRYREGADWSWNPGSGLNLAIGVPKLSAVRVEGAAVVEVDSPRGESFSATSTGAGSILARNIDVVKAEIRTAGSGSITVGGRASDVTYSVEGAGSIDAKGLRSARAQILITGAGSASADVTEEALITRTGNGRVEVVGGASCTKRPSNASRVECR